MTSRKERFEAQRLAAALAGARVQRASGDAAAEGLANAAQIDADSAQSDIDGLVGLLESMAFQSAAAVAITGGSVQGLTLLRAPDGVISAGGAVGLHFNSYTDTGLTANANNVCVIESGVFALVLSALISEFRVPSGFSFAWSSAADNLSAADTKVSRHAANVCGPDGPWRLKSYTVATLPSAATAGAGGMVYVSDETAGAVPAFSDGANWRRVTDRAVVS